MLKQSAKSRKHWTPHYVLSRARVLLDQKRNPDDPWLTREAIDLLAQLLRPCDVALEFGSGRSTRWIARRVAHVTSVEHDQIWYQAGVDRLKTEALTNVNLLLRPLDVAEAEAAKAAYVRVLDDIKDQSLDFCLVDGMYRGACALGTISKIRSGGIIAVDNAGWFLPSSSRTPGARAIGTGTYDEAWAEFAEQTQSWRRVWTTSGVTDTVILFKN